MPQQHREGQTYLPRSWAKRYVGKSGHLPIVPQWALCHNGHTVCPMATATAAQKRPSPVSAPAASIACCTTVPLVPSHQPSQGCWRILCQYDWQELEERLMLLSHPPIWHWLTLGGLNQDWAIVWAEKFLFNVENFASRSMITVSSLNLEMADAIMPILLERYLLDCTVGPKADWVDSESVAVW